MENTGYQCAACGSTEHDPAYCERCFRVICMGCIVKLKNGGLMCLSCVDESWKACSCVDCRGACARRPCWPTPDEARKLIEAGYGNRLWLDYWVGGGYDGGDIYILAPAAVGNEGRAASFWPTGQCTFFTDDGRCEIHDVAKPMEGRLLSCDDSTPKDLHWIVASAWNNPEAQELAEEWRAMK